MKDTQIDEYIASQEQWKQDILTQLRDIMHVADPDIVEAFKWGSPTFEHAGQVTWMPVATHWVHISFRQGALLDAPDGTWTEDDETLSKAKRTIKIRQGDGIDRELLIRLVKQAVKNNIAGKKIEFNVTKPGSKTFDLSHEYESILADNGFLEAYKERPYYQQKGWIEWIESAKTDSTKQARISRMLIELKYDQYMPPKNERKHS